MTSLHTLMFADQAASRWGVFWLPPGVGSASLACRANGEPDAIEVELQAADEDEAWRLEGARASLTFTPSGPAGHGGSAETLESLDQLCAVSGRIAVGATEDEIDCLGWRTRADGNFDLSQIDTIRQTCGWFDPADGVSLLALRPRKARGQDTDLVAATVLEQEPPPRVEDPRLSSTYDAAGVPARVGLELWFAHDEAGEDTDEEGRREFPRRAAGETVGDGLAWDAGEFKMRAVPLEWHSRGTDGTGVYLLGQRG